MEIKKNVRDAKYPCLMCKRDFHNKCLQDKGHRHIECACSARNHQTEDK